MKRSFALGAIVLAGVFVVSAVSQEKNGSDPKDVKVFMRAKLVHSQKVLEGLTLEDFGSIVKHAQQLSLLSQDASWNVIETQEYYERSADFRRSLDDLKAAAQQKNLDGAALGYMGVTLKCIECHRYLRTVQHVEAK
jgi:cytochrome c556